jgi:anti-sigma factor RsiW
MNERPITEEDLHAHIDRVLDSAREVEVTAYLAAHPDVATRIHGYARQRTDLRAALAPIAEEPLPPELDLARMIARQRRPRQTRQVSWSAFARRPWCCWVSAALAAGRCTASASRAKVSWRSRRKPRQTTPSMHPTKPARWSCAPPIAPNW